MKLLLIIPHQKVTYKPSIDLPLGVLSIAGYLRAKDWDGTVEVYDTRLSGKVHKDADGVDIFGDTSKEIEGRIKAFQPDVVGISNMFSFQIGQALAVADIAKKACPQAVTVLGGPHASSFPTEMIAHENIDYVVMGEGEIRLGELLQSIRKREKPSIQGVIGGVEDLSLLRSSKKTPIRFFEPLDDLAFPAYDKVDVERYFHLQSSGFSSRPRKFGKRTVTMLTSRGCPHQCVFCSVQTTMGYKWRHHSPDYVKRHIEHLIADYRIDYIHFQDDNFTHDPDRYDAILDVLLALERPLRWDTPNGVRGDSWTHERISKTKASGCQYLIVAIESGVQRVIDEVVKKRLDLSQVDDFMQACKAEKLRCYAFYVIGLPGETEKEIVQTIDYALKKFKDFDVLPTIHKVTALPGTELFEIVLNNNYYDHELEYKMNQIVTDEFNPEIIDREYNRFLSKLIFAIIKKVLFQPGQMVIFLKLVIGYRWFMFDLLKGTIKGVVGR